MREHVAEPTCSTLVEASIEGERDRQGVCRRVNLSRTESVNPSMRALHYELRLCTGYVDGYSP